MSKQERTIIQAWKILKKQDTDIVEMCTNTSIEGKGLMSASSIRIGIKGYNFVSVQNSLYFAFGTVTTIFSAPASTSLSTFVLTSSWVANRLLGNFWWKWSKFLISKSVIIEGDESLYPKSSFFFKSSEGYIQLISGNNVFEVILPLKFEIWVSSTELGEQNHP